MLTLVNPTAFASAADSAPNMEQCSTYDAVYKPIAAGYPSVNASRENEDSLSFTLTIHKPMDGGKGGSHRTRFFYFDAYDNATGEKISTLRMADVCSNGVVRCGINTYEGQFRKNDEMKELEFIIGFDPIALRKDFSRTKYWDSQAPYAYIFPDTLAVFHSLKSKLNIRSKESSVSVDTLVSDFVAFHSPKHALPDFGGKDVWLLDHCTGAAKD